MRKDVWQYVQSKKWLQMFIREQPRWYRTLSRDPNQLAAFELAALQYYEQTVPQKVEKVASSLEMASLMLQMMKAMRD